MAYIGSKGRCFIFGALPVERLPVKPEPQDMIIAADKGYDTVLSLGLRPDITVGDFDSRGAVPETENVIVLPVRKADTDVGHAVELGFARGYADFVICGAVGGLLDHTMANVVIALDIALRGGRAWFLSDDFSFTVLHNAALELPSRGEGRLSVFALSDMARGVEITGLDYEARALDLPRTSHLGVSNAFIGKPARIAVENGDLLVMVQGIIDP